MSAYGAEVAGGDELDTQDGGGVAVEETGAGTGAEDQSGATDIQDRMSEELEDDAWYSESTGAVVDKDGNSYLNPKNGLPFKSMAEYEAARKALGEPTAKPKTETPAPPPQAEPMSKPFEQYIAENGKINANTLLEMSKVEAGYQYKDELIPKINAPAPGAQQQPAKPITPTQRAEESRKTLVTHLVGPLQKIEAALIANGADSAAARQFMAPFVEAQTNMINEEYRQQLVGALKEEADSKVAPILTQDQETKLKTASEGNVSKLAQAYFPKGGTDAFMTLLNGYNTKDAAGKATFVRGPAAHIMDLLVNVAQNGKQFASQEEVHKAYKDTFLRLTANPATARILFDLTHNYYKGKNVGIAYEQGKQKGADQQKQIKKFVRPQPQSVAAGVEDEDKDMPSMLRAALNRSHGSHIA